MLRLIKKIEYWPRGVSDHSPLILTVNLHDRCTPRMWTINPLWMELMEKPEEITLRLKEFVELNRGMCGTL